MAIEARSTAGSLRQNTKAPRLSTSVKMPWGRATKPMIMAFEGVEWETDKGKQVLHNCSGVVHPGQVLAIMGPSGAGKTTLVNVLAGRTLASRGVVTLNGNPLNKRQRRNIAYVMQNDILLTNLTVKETLTYAALLRMPGIYGRNDKHERVDALIEQLGLTKAIDTRVGDDVKRGISGGERKRVSIGIEMLAEPAVIILDEPTSGLDAATAAMLIETLRDIATNERRTVLMTIHQPSSRMYAEFDRLLLLADGHTMYAGAAGAALDHFEAAGLPCTVHYNPADFFLEILAEPNVRQQMLAYNAKHVSASKTEDMTASAMLTPMTLENGPSSAAGDATDVTSRWPTTFWQQIVILTGRSFKQNRGNVWTAVNFLQSFAVAFVAGGAWFQTGATEDSIQDRVGYYFFTAAYWGFQSLFVATQTFPAERSVMMKERAAGTYRLSSYLLAKSFSDMPLVMLQPAIYLVISYFMAGLSADWRFIAILSLTMLYCTAVHSVGLFIGAVVMDGKRAATASTIVMLSAMIFGGFYVQNLPTGLNELRYISVVRYLYFAMLTFEYEGRGRFDCSLSASAYSACAPVNQMYANGTDLSNVNTRLITGDMVLKNYDVSTSFVEHVMALIGFLLVFRLFTYFALKYLHSTKSK